MDKSKMSLDATFVVSWKNVGDDVVYNVRHQSLEEAEAHLDRVMQFETVVYANVVVETTVQVLVKERSKLRGVV